MNTAYGWIARTWARLGEMETRGRFRPRSVDIAIAILVLLLVAGSELAFRTADAASGSPLTIAVPLLVVGLLLASAPLIVRRLYPRTVFALALLGAIAVETTPWRDIGADLGVLVALGTVAAYRPLKETVAAVVAVMGAATVATALEFSRGNWEALVGSLGGSLPVVVAAAGIGYAIGQRRRSRNAELAAAELRGREAVIEERARIARELHDVVAHGVSVMTVQAGGARMSLDRDTGATREALEAIETTGRESLNEMRRLLGVLRGDDEMTADRPQPRVEDIAELVERTRSAGLPVTFRNTGVTPELSTGLALTIYRIVQESLTNIIKHANATEAQIALNFEKNAVVIEVTDNGRGPADDGPSGHGLAGMRERVTLFDGTLETGAGPSGGFRIRAEIPVEGVS